MSAQSPVVTTQRPPSTMPVLHLAGGLLVMAGIVAVLFGFLMWEDEARTGAGRWVIVLGLALSALGTLASCLGRWMDSKALRRHLTR